MSMKSRFDSGGVMNRILNLGPSIVLAGVAIFMSVNQAQAESKINNWLSVKRAFGNL